MTNFNGFTFEAINYDPKTHIWEDVSKQPLQFKSIKFDFDVVRLEVGLTRKYLIIDSLGPRPTSATFSDCIYICQK
jgi:hypothetical protein